MDKIPRFHYDSVDHTTVNYSIMYNTHISKFEPGDNIDMDVVMVNKTDLPVTSIMIVFHGENKSWKIESRKIGLFVKKIKDNSLCEKEEKDLMMKALNNGLGTRFKFKLPRQKKRLKYIEVWVYWGLHKKSWVTIDYI